MIFIKICKDGILWKYCKVYIELYLFDLNYFNSIMKLQCMKMI